MKSRATHDGHVRDQVSLLQGTAHTCTGSGAAVLLQCLLQAGGGTGGGSLLYSCLVSQQCLPWLQQLQGALLVMPDCGACFWLRITVQA